MKAYENNLGETAKRHWIQEFTDFQMIASQFRKPSVSATRAPEELIAEAEEA